MDSIEKILTTHFSGYPYFTIHKTERKGVNSIMARFHVENCEFEISAQLVPARHYLGFHHRVIEHKILEMKGE
jgi:hypothetical protein